MAGPLKNNLWYVCSFGYILIHYFISCQQFFDNKQCEKYIQLFYTFESIGHRCYTFS